MLQRRAVALVVAVAATAVVMRADVAAAAAADPPLQFETAAMLTAPHHPVIVTSGYGGSRGAPRRAFLEDTVTPLALPRGTLAAEAGTAPFTVQGIRFSEPTGDACTPPCMKDLWQVVRLPFPVASFGGRYQAKYFKLQIHRVPGMETASHFIWVDTDMALKKGFTQDLLNRLGDRDALFLGHRSDFPSEIAALGRRFTTGYNFKEQQRWYQAAGLPMGKKDLIAVGGIFVRRNNDVMNAFFDEWWHELAWWGDRDQPALAYMLWKWRQSGAANIKVEPWTDAFNVYSGPYHRHT